MRQRRSHKFVFSLGGLANLLFALSIIPVSAQPIALKLRNGDRLTGNVIFENTNHVVFSNIWTKEITIPLADILARETNAPIVAVTEVSPVATTNPAVVAKTNTVPAPTPAAKPVAVAAAKPEVKTRPFKDWHGDAQIGLDVGINQNTRQLYHGRFKVTYAPVSNGGTPGDSKLVDRFRNTFEYNAAYGTVTSEQSDGSSKTDLSANLMNGSSKTDFDLAIGQRAFVYNLFGAGYDEIRRIDRRYEFGPGIGYHLFTRSNFVMNVEAGLNYQAQRTWSKPADRTLPRDYSWNRRLYYRFAEDLTWKISKRLTLDEKFEIFPEVDFDEYRFRFETNLRYWLLENISFNLTVLDTYDTQAAPNVDKNDLQIRSSVGVKF